MFVPSMQAQTATIALAKITFTKVPFKEVRIVDHPSLHCLQMNYEALHAALRMTRAVLQ